MKFPEWAPKDLVELYEQHPVENGLLKRLLEPRSAGTGESPGRLDSMDKVWKLVEKCNPGEPGFRPGPLYFFHYVQSAVMMARQTYLTPGESVKKMEDISSLAKELKVKIEGLPTINSIPIHLYTLPDDLRIEFVMSKFNRRPASVSDLLRIFSSQIESELAKQKNGIPILPYPNKLQPKETFFVRYMADFFESKLDGKRHPEQLAVVARRTLDNDQIDMPFVVQQLRNRSIV